MILLSSVSLSNIQKSSKVIYKVKKTQLIYSIIYLYSTKPFPDNSFCLSVFRCGGNFDLVSFSSGLTLSFCLLECNLDFINVLGI